ncbi:MAG: alpha/beta fold hydrolase [Ignavibacteriaceae bacterium]|nr:alpha/beta fold hydrolase [Ignavibacteriaceae bacterium]
MKKFNLIISVILIHSSLFAINPEKKYILKPEWYNIIYEEISFATSDGYKLKGWFYPAQDSSKLLLTCDTTLCYKNYKEVDDVQKPTIIICDGDAKNMSWLLWYAKQLVVKGFNVFTFDWRGFGESDNWSTERNYLSYSEFLLDYDAAVDYVKSRNEVDTSKIGVFGFSTGAYLSFAIAAKRNDISAFAGRALMTSFNDILPILKKLTPDRNLIAPPNYPSELEPINAAEKTNIPVFLIVGEKDNRTPIWMSEKIKSKIKSYCELWVVPNAEHGGVNSPEWAATEEFFNRLSLFFKQYL